MKGVLDENETKTCDALKSEKDKLLNRLKVEVSIKIYIHNYVHEEIRERDTFIHPRRGHLLWV